jgi:hypothetical protein
MNNRKPYHKRKFDFEIGYLIKSPCKTCITRYQFPGCIRSCDILDSIQNHLAQGISVTRNFNAAESFHLQLDSRRGK